MKLPLQVVATPIGNLGDLSPRAVEVLAAAEVIACEDTRRTATLLRHAGITRPTMVVLNDHTERGVASGLVERLAAGERVVLVSDAGMPAISDPGWLLVRAVLERGMEVDVVPGPSAVITALVASGLPTDRFCFDGFLPRKGAERSARLDDVARERRTVVLYEAPHRLDRTLADLAGRCGADRPVAVAREMTKRYQEVWRGTLAGAVEWAGEASPKGEIVIVVGGAPRPADVTDEEIVAAVAAEMAAGASRKDAVAAIAAAMGTPRRRVYDLALEHR